MVRQYETVLIFTPVLSEGELKKAIEKYLDFLKKVKSEIVHEENWGLKQLAYAIQKKTTGYYYLVEFKTEAANIKNFETELSRDEHVMRYMTTRLDKYALDYNEKKRAGLIGKKVEKEEKQEA